MEVHMKSVTLHYQEPLIRRAVWAFWRRATGWTFFAATGVLLGSLIALLAAGDTSWFVGLIGAVFLLAVGFAGALYFVHLRASLTRFRRMEVPEARLEMKEETFRLIADSGTSELAWGAITQIWRFPDFWLVFLSPAQFFTLPLADLDEESREFLLGKARSHRAKIR